MQGQMGDFSRETEITKNNQMKMPELKAKQNGQKHKRIDTAQERINELQYRSKETTQSESQREKINHHHHQEERPKSCVQQYQRALHIGDRNLRRRGGTAWERINI